MRLYVMRHGAAVDVGEQGVKTDDARMLSAAGQLKTRQVAEGLAAIGVRPDHIGSSPLVRARETAEIAAKVLCENSTVEVCEFLRPNSHTGKLVKWLQQRPGDSALITGHVPDVSMIISELIGNHGDCAITMKKAAVACIVFDEIPGIGKGELEWLLQPDQLRRLRN
jgi:phosphohistidine phosphatase